MRQRIGEPFDVIVADDGSQDATVEIIKSYANYHPHIQFTFLDSSLHIGITGNYKRAFDASYSEYIAVMEGDDYWSRPYKLARQIDFLDEHLECNLCSVNRFIFDEKRLAFTIARRESKSAYTLHNSRELIWNHFIGNFSTCMYRRTTLSSIPSKLFDMDTADWGVNICASRSGLIGFINEPMSVYRVHSGGSWSGLSLSLRHFASNSH